MLICLAAPRPATAELAQIRNADLNLIDLAQSTHPPTTPAIRSRTSISPLDRLASTHTPSPRRSNPHSARGTATPSLIAVSSLGGFPTPALRARGTVIIGPASENLHKRRHSHCNRFSYSITSSARSRMDVGTVRPSAIAVLRLTTSANLVGACTGRLAAFSPLRMRSTYDAAARNELAMSAP